MEYDKIIIEEHSPKNGCHAKKNEELTAAAAKDKFKGRLRKDGYFFVGIKSREPSSYGWVKKTESSPGKIL